MYFNIPIDNDVTYLLSQIGHNVKINNVPARAIINNTNQERNYDDKRIITHEQLSRGQYINYNNLWWIVISEVNAERYNAYYKAIIRRCNYDVNFVIDGKLYQFYSIIESNKFIIENNNLFNTSADIITITIPATDITNKIQTDDRIIKFSTAWKITGVDYTQKGLVIIHCKRDTVDENTDIIDREIADKNKLENIDAEPILPFEEEPTEPEEPEEPSNYRIEIDGYDIIMFGTIEPYTVKVYENDVEVDKELKFEIIGDETLIWIERTGDNWCELKANKDRIFGSVIFRVSLAEDETVYTEMEISAVAF